MRLITGDECGLLKEIIPEKSPRVGAHHDPVEDVGLNPEDAIRWIDPTQIQCRHRGIVSLSFLPPPVNEDEDEKDVRFAFAALRIDGSVETWEASSSSGRGGRNSKKKKRTMTKGNDVLDYRKTCSYTGNIFDDDNTGVIHKSNGTSDVDDALLLSKKKMEAKPIGMGVLLPSKIIACNSYGQIRILSTTSTTSSSTSTRKLNVVARYDDASAANVPRSSDGHTYTKGTTVTSMAVSPGSGSNGSGSVIAIGGRDRETLLMDLETGQVFWKAKNLKPDPQTLLEQPIFTTCMEFLHRPLIIPGPRPPPPRAASASASAAVVDDEQGGGGGHEEDGKNNNNNNNNNLLAVGTAYKQVRIYDIRSIQRRPVLQTPPDGQLIPYRVTSICQLNEYNIAVGDAGGTILNIDTRKPNEPAGRFKGPAGSVRGMKRHDTQDVLASVGLDRRLRTYDLKKKNRRRPIHSLYLKQRINDVLFCSDGPWKQHRGDDDDDDDEEEEDDEGGGRGGNGGDDGDGCRAMVVAGDSDQESGLEDDDVRDYSSSSSSPSSSSEDEDDDDEDDENHTDKKNGGGRRDGGRGGNNNKKKKEEKELEEDLVVVEEDDIDDDPSLNSTSEEDDDDGEDDEDDSSTSGDDDDDDEESESESESDSDGYEEEEDVNAGRKNRSAARRGGGTTTTSTSQKKRRTT